MTLYARQQKRQRCKEQSFGLCGRMRGWDDLRGWCWNVYITICDADHQSRFDAWDRVLRAGALGWPWGMGWGGRWEEGSGWGTHVHPCLIHADIWQKPLQYCKLISFQLKLINWFLINKKLISYLNAYLWNLGRLQWWSYLQGSNRDADIENRLVGKSGEGEGRTNGESSEEAHAPSCVT